MTMQITTAVQVPPIFAIIYGPPGVGKSTLLATMDTPYVLDFDRGYHRALWVPSRHEIRSWQDVLDIINGRTDLDITGYKSLGIDTLGRALELCADYVGQRNPKLMTGASLNQRGFGELYNEFRRLLTWARNHSLPVIATAHEVEGIDAAEKRFFRPSVLGRKAIQDMMQSVDLMGRLTLDDADRRVLKLRSSSEMLSKDPVGLGFLPVPDGDKVFAARLLTTVRQRMQERANENAKKEQELRAFVESMREAINLATDAESFTLTLEDIKSEMESYEESTKSIVRTIVTRRAEVLGLAFDKGAGVWKQK